MEPTGVVSLTFNELRTANVRRCEGPVFGHTVATWSPTDWACAMAGEVGEACNLIKKLRRGEDVPLEDIARELADTVTYADLLAARLGIDLGFWTAQKFNEVSVRRGAPDRLRLCGMPFVALPGDHLRCGHCGGKGEIMVDRDAVFAAVLCPRCAGTGLTACNQPKAT